MEMCLFQDPWGTMKNLFHVCFHDREMCLSLIHENLHEKSMQTQEKIRMDFLCNLNTTFKSSEYQFTKKEFSKDLEKI